MKLLACLVCRDVRSIKQVPTTCECGSSVARYVDDLHVEFSGPCHILGMDNRDLRRMVWFAKRSRLPERPYEVNASWWVINPDWKDSHIKEVSDGS